MDLGRFHAAIDVLNDHYTTLKIQARLQSLIANLTTLAGNPTNQAQADQFKSQLAELIDNLTTDPVNSSPYWMKSIFMSIGASANSGVGLAQELSRVVANNQFSPSLTAQEMTKLNTQVTEFQGEVTAIRNAFKKLHVCPEELEPGDSEISVIVPIKPRTKSLKDLSQEAKQWHTALSHISEVFDADGPPISIRALATGSWLFYLYSTPPVLYGVHLCIKGVNQILADLLATKGIVAQLRTLNAPSAAIDQIEKDNEAKLGRQLRELAENIVNENYKNGDVTRKEELKNAMSQAMTTLAHKLAEGAVVDLQLAPPARPTIAENAEPTAQEAEQLKVADYVDSVRAQLDQERDKLLLKLPPDEVAALLPAYEETD